MTLANTITQLRKQKGWSQEELAIKLDVSRQSVSKWESAQSTPDLNKIVKLSELFDVSTDYLIKNDAGTMQAHHQATQNYQATVEKTLSLEHALNYIEVKTNALKSISYGAGLCVCSPITLLILLALSNSGLIMLSKNMAIIIGLISLLLCIIFAVSLFIRSHQEQVETHDLENSRFILLSSTRATIAAERKAFISSYTLHISIGVGLFILSSVPFLISAILGGPSYLTMLMVAAIFPIISIGLRLVIPASTQLEALDLILNGGDLDANKSDSTKNAEKLGAFYWPLIVAIFLGWSFWSNAWDVTWVMWPVAAVAFASLVGLMSLLKKQD